MQRKDLALRVLSTAAIMSIVTSIAAPAFAGTYYIGKGSIDVVTSTDGNVHVIQNRIAYIDRDNEIVIKDGTSEADTTLKDANRAAATPAADPAATHATQELEAAGSADAAGESQPDPDAAFTLSEAEEDSAQTQEGKDTTEEKKDPAEDSPKEDVVYQYDPADPEPEQQATKLAPTTSATPTAKTKEVTLDDAPTTPASPVGSAENPTTNVIKVVNNWVGAAAKELKIRLSNVNIKTEGSVYESPMDISGGGTTKVELDGQNVLDSSNTWRAGLRKQGEGTLIITDETDDTGNKITAPKSDTSASGSLTAKGGGSNGSAGIGGNIAESTKNIIIEGYATVNATGGGNGAGIGGGGGAGDSRGSGNAENIIIRGHSKVTASANNGAAIGGGSNGSYWGSHSGYWGGSAKGIVIRDHATVVAKCHGIVGTGAFGAAIGAAGYSGDFAEAEVTIGTPGATAEQEDVHIIATGRSGSAIGNGGSNTKVTIQGHVTIQTASSNNSIAIGSNYGNVEVNIKDNASIDTATGAGASGIGGGYLNRSSGRTVKVNIDGAGGNVKLGENSAIIGSDGAISATEVTIKDHVLLKMKQSGGENGEYIKVKNNAGNEVEAEVGTRSNPTAGGLVNTIGDNTELWYTDYYNKLQKIVHGKNLCTKHETNHKDATCTTPGSKTYQCTYEKENGAVNPEHKDQWVENTDIDPNAHNYVKTTVPPTCGAQGYDEYTCKNNPDHTYKDNFVAPTGQHTYGEWTTVKEATCTTAGQKQRTCKVCNHVDTQEIPALDHDFHGTETVTKAPTCAETGTKTVQCTRCTEVETQTIPIDSNAHNYQDDWTVTTPATCTTEGVETRYCHNDHSHSETRPTAKDSSNHTGHGTYIDGYVAPTCTKDGYTGDTRCDGCHAIVIPGKEIPATGHHWKDNGDGTHTCTKCGATEGQPVNTNSALELRVVDAEGMDQPFTVSQNGTLRTYTGAYDTATLTGNLNTLRYLQDHGAQTIQFVTNGQTSSFDINDLLAQGSGSEVFYLTHRGTEEPTLLLVEADHSELVKD